MSLSFRWLLPLVPVLFTSCEVGRSGAGPSYPPTPGYAPPPPGPAPPPPGLATPPAATSPGPAPPATAPPPAVAGPDPLEVLDRAWLRGAARTALGEVLQGLPDAPRQRVASVPLIVDERATEVNAFATCSASGAAAMAITDGLLEVMAHLARCRAADDTFGGDRTGRYIEALGRRQRAGSPILRPDPLPADQETDARKRARQHHLFQEQVAFVLGHELAHHYLGHLPCTPGGPLSPGEVGRLLASAVPLLNQPQELAADVAGVQSVLRAGARRADQPWTEGGALLTLQFFAGVDRFSALDVLFAFERTHPPPIVRAPVLQHTANAWRLSGGTLPFPQ